jgi:hypothetical protein
MSGACTCCPGKSYMGQRKMGPKKRRIWPVTLQDFSWFCIVPRGASGDSYLAVATFCLHRRREAVRVLMDCRLRSNLVVFAGFANSALCEESKELLIRAFCSE